MASSIHNDIANRPALINNISSRQLASRRNENTNPHRCAGLFGLFSCISSYCNQNTDSPVLEVNCKTHLMYVTTTACQLVLGKHRHPLSDSYSDRQHTTLQAES